MHMHMRVYDRLVVFAQFSQAVSWYERFPCKLDPICQRK
jgi:hypothetical protein